MYAFTINGFPYGTFHGQAVKEDVYRPDWRQTERLEYTCRLGDLLAAVLPDGMSGSISTVPVSYREWMRDDQGYQVAVEQLAACAASLNDLRDQTGREVHLGLEPEPDCLLETTDDTIGFFDRYLRPRGVAWLRKERGRSISDAEAILQRHVGVCFDTCHLSVQFERLDLSIAALVREGIRISKVQISAALRTRMGAAGTRQLEAFVEPVYLHQARIMDARGRKRECPDLTHDFLAGWAEASEPCECRVHFHVPLHMPEHDGMSSTADGVTSEFLCATAASSVQHYEIETYTFHVLPPALRRQAVERSIADEYAWTLDRFATIAFSEQGAGSHGHPRD
jgi:sugar phosphate isomerase/epimerase